jgi:hypothetical protein
MEFLIEDQEVSMQCPIFEEIFVAPIEEGNTWLV